MHYYFEMDIKDGNHTSSDFIKFDDIQDFVDFVEDLKIEIEDNLDFRFSFYSSEEDL